MEEHHGDVCVVVVAVGGGIAAYDDSHIYEVPWDSVFFEIRFSVEAKWLIL